MRNIARLVAFVAVLAFAPAAWALGPYYVRIGGGNLSQCDGLTNVPVAGSTGGHCAWNKVSTASQNVPRGSTTFVAPGSYVSDAIKPNQTPTQESERITFICSDDGATACAPNCTAACDIVPSTGISPLELSSPVRSFITVNGFTFHNESVHAGSGTARNNTLLNIKTADDAIGAPMPTFRMAGQNMTLTDFDFQCERTKSTPATDCAVFGDSSVQSTTMLVTNGTVRGGRNNFIDFCTNCVFDGVTFEDTYNHVLTIGQSDSATCSVARGVRNLTLQNCIFPANSDFYEPVPDFRSVDGLTLLNNVFGRIALPFTNGVQCIEGAVKIRNNAFVNYNITSKGEHLHLYPNQTAGGTALVYDIDYNAYIGSSVEPGAGGAVGNVQGTSVAWWVDTRSGSFSAYPDPDSDGVAVGDVTAQSDFVDWQNHGTNPDGSKFDEHSIVVANLDYRYKANLATSGKFGARVWGKSAPTWSFITECTYAISTPNAVDTNLNFSDAMSNSGDVVELDHDGVVRSTLGFSAGHNPAGDCAEKLQFVPAFTAAAQIPRTYTWWKSWGQQDADGDGIPAFSTVTDVITPANRDGWDLVNGSPLIDGGDSANCGRPAGQIRGVACDIGPKEANQAAAPILSVIANVSFVEGTPPLSQYFMVASINQPIGTPVTFDYTVASGTATTGTACSAAGTTDVLPPNLLTTGSATITPPATSVALPFLICDDSDIESTETFTTTLSNVSTNVTSGNLVQVVSITDNDTLPPPTLTISNQTQSEGQTPMNFTLTLSRALTTTITGTYQAGSSSATMGASCDGTKDGIFVSSTFSITPGTTVVTIPVTICDDTNVESTEALLLSLSGVTSGVTLVNNPGIGTILDNDTGGSLPTVSIGDVSTSEVSNQVTLSITMSKTDAAPVTFARAASGGSATGGAACTAGVDYITPSVGPLLGIPAGQTSTTLTIQLCPDTLVEGDETFTVTLSSISSNATFLDSTATVTILDDDQNLTPSGNLFYGATMYGINPVSAGPPPPPALALCGAAPDYGVILNGGCTCTGTIIAGTQCFCGTVSGCADGAGGTIPSITWQIRVTPRSSACGSTANGTILWMPGLGNSAFSTDATVAPDVDGNGVQDFRDTLVNLAASPNCYRSIETRWGPVGGQGWHDLGVLGIPAGVMRALARPASLHRYLKEQFSQTGGAAFCAFGSSGGAAQLATDLATFGESDVFDAVVLGSGPWNSRMDLGCTATQASTFLGDGYPNAGSTVIDLSNGYAQNTGPCYTAPTCPPEIPDCATFFFNDSLLGPFGIRFKFDSPGQQTKIISIRGLSDLTSGAPVQAERFWQKVADMTYGGSSGALLPAIQDFTGAVHDVASSSTVDAFLTATFAADCVPR